MKRRAIGTCRTRPPDILGRADFGGTISSFSGAQKSECKCADLASGRKTGRQIRVIRTSESSSRLIPMIAVVTNSPGIQSLKHSKWGYPVYTHSDTLQPTPGGAPPVRRQVQ